MSLYHEHAWCLHKPEEGVRPSVTIVTDGRKQLYEFWKPNMFSVREAVVLNH